MRLSTVFTGWFSVALKEGRMTLLSLRLIIIAAILALAVLAGIFAISPGGVGGAPSKLAYSFAYYPDLNYSRPALAIFVTSPTGQPLQGVEVQLVNLTRGFGQTRDVLATKPTDTSGWARFEGLAQLYPNRDLGVGLAEDPAGAGPYAGVSTRPGFGSGSVMNRGQLQTRLLALGGAPDQQVLSLVFFESRGLPVAGADVYILHLRLEERPPPVIENYTPPGGWNPYRNGTTDGNGYYLRSQPLGPGQYMIRVAKGALNATTFFGFSAPPSPFTFGPDGVLAFAGFLFVPLILPVMGLVVGYDAVARERAEGTLDLLLSKPVGRIGVALGKLGGAFASMALPVVAVLLAAAALIWGRTGQSPSGAFTAALLGEALLLLLIYTVLFLGISALVRGLGTALLFSILFYLLFALFWGVISFLVASITAQPGSVAWFETVNLMSIVSPTGVYQQLLSRSLPGLTGVLFGGPGGVGQSLPLTSIVVSAVLWVALPLALFLWTMKYRVTEG